MNIFIKYFNIDNYYINDKEISIYPLTIFSYKDNYLLNLIWYISDFHFFEFYRINDYELLSISKIISGIMEHDKYDAIINNNMILECINFINDVLNNNRDKILSKLFKENYIKYIDDIYLKLDYHCELSITSFFERDDIINIIFTFNEKSFSSKIFFSRKIDIFTSILENIFRILFNNNIFRNLYIADCNFNNITLEDAAIKNMNIMDFIFKINEIKIKENVSDYNMFNRNDLIQLFLKNYNHNIIIENFESINNFVNLFYRYISNNEKNILLSCYNISKLDSFIYDKRFSNYIHIY